MTKLSRNRPGTSSAAKVAAWALFASAALVAGTASANDPPLQIGDTLVDPFLYYDLGSYSVAHENRQTQSFSDGSGLPYIQGGTSLSGSVTRGGGNTSSYAVVSPGYVRLGAFVSGFASCGLPGVDERCPWSTSIYSYASAGISHMTAIINTSTNPPTGLQQNVAPIEVVLDQSVFNASASGISSIGGNAYLDLRIGNTNVFYDLASVLWGDRNPAFEVSGTGIPLLLQVPFEYEYNVPFMVIADLYVSVAIFAGLGAEGGSIAGGSALSAFPASFRWLGVELNEGEQFVGPIDWSQPAAVVPIPAAGWLFLSGLAGLAALRRRSRGLATP